MSNSVSAPTTSLGILILAAVSLPKPENTILALGAIVLRCATMKLAAGSAMADDHIRAMIDVLLCAIARHAIYVNFVAEPGKVEKLEE